MKREPTAILVIDDQDTILADFARLLEPTDPGACDDALDELAATLGGPQRTTKLVLPTYQVSYARQGADGVRVHATAVAAGRPPAVAFIDIHMPPGIDGVETAAQLWRAQADLEIVLCTAHSDYSWQGILERLTSRDQLVILRKPFEPIEVRQLASCLSEKWLRGRALARRMEDLEAQVASEVARRMQHELALSQKFEALGRLAAGIAHEINTPTQYIQSSIEFVTEACRDLAGGLTRLREAAPAHVTATDELATLDDLLVDIPRALADAQHGVDRVTAIVRSMRDYAHTSERRELEPVDINRQIHMIAELARNQYKNDAELVLELGNVPTVPGNADELGRALLNLLINAAQAVQAARVRGSLGRITITTRATADAVIIDIADTGVGIPREHWPRVFEPFFTTKPRGQGTGQGLAIARTAIVEHHHGKLEFDSQPGRGTTFHIALPIAGRQGVAA